MIDKKSQGKNLRFWKSRLETALGQVKADIERYPYFPHESERQYVILLDRVRFEDVYLSEEYERKYEGLFE